MGLVESGKLPKPLTALLNTARRYSMWVYQWGLACCAIEMGAAFGSPRYDVMRLGVIPLPASPRHADFVVISGTWWMGTGEKFDPESTVPAPAGSYVIHYGGKVHYDGAKNEETIIQVWGMGPATSTPVGPR